MLMVFFAARCRRGKRRWLCPIEMLQRDCFSTGTGWAPGLLHGFPSCLFSPTIRVRENRELEEGTVIEFVVEKEEEEEMVIPEEDDTWMLNIDDQDAVLLAAACDSNGEHGMHVIYAYMCGLMINI